MKKKIALLLAFLSLRVFAEKTEISVMPFVQFSNGILEETIYSSDVKRKKLSFLEWNYCPLVQTGCLLKIKKGAFFANFDAVFALPFECGQMYDSDWLYSSSFTGKCTYSINPEKANLNCSSSIKLGALYSIKMIYFGFFACAEYRYNSFETHDGYGWYGRTYGVSWDDPKADYAPKLYPIEFLRHSFYSWAGISSGVNICNKVNLLFDFLISPFAYESSIDYHHGKINPFYTMIPVYAFFKRFRTEATVSFDVTKKIDFSITGGFLYGPTEQGEHLVRHGSEDKGYDEFETTAQATGSGIKEFYSRVGIKIRVK